MISLERLHIRAAFFRCVRQFFREQGFLEVDTPLLLPSVIPEANIVHFQADQQFLQSSPEQCMKMLLAAGCEKIFQICPSFRKEENGRLHLEQFQILEWYRSGSDYNQLMTDCEQLVLFLVEQLHAQLFQNQSPVEISEGETGNIGAGCKTGLFAQLDLSPPWQRLSVEEAFYRYSPVKLEEAQTANMFDEILVEYVEPQLGLNKPTFLCDYPAEMASLAKRKECAPHLAERFELYIRGVEVANGFSELTDPQEQAARFQDEIELIERQRGESLVAPVKFLEALGRINQAAGIALGLDRLLMIALNKKKISDVVSFTPLDFM